MFGLIVKSFNYQNKFHRYKPNLLYIVYYHLPIHPRTYIQRLYLYINRIQLKFVNSRVRPERLDEMFFERQRHNQNKRDIIVSYTPTHTIYYTIYTQLRNSSLHVTSQIIIKTIPNSIYSFNSLLKKSYPIFPLPLYSL